MMTETQKDQKLIRRFVHVQWWTKLRVLKAQGLKLGSRRERERKINYTAAKIYGEFHQLDDEGKEKERLAMLQAISEFESCAS